MRELKVYNLEFPDYVNTLEIGEYKFKRVDNYGEVICNLQWLVRVIGGEFDRKLSTGTHQITATVELPDKEKQAILPWGEYNKCTRLNDVLLLLTLFSGRNVFALKDGEEKFPIIQDSRGHFFGGQFTLSAHHDVKWQNQETGNIFSENEINGNESYEYNPVDLGFEKTINQALETIASDEWQNKYDKGYSLFLFRQAMRQYDIEPAFILCWTIWEHLFTINNRIWLDNISIEQMSGDKKIAFILNRYLLVDVDVVAQKEIKRITKARNRLIHYGMKPDNVDIKEMELIIRLTEQIMAIVLGLQPSNAFNSFEKLKEFLGVKSR